MLDPSADARLSRIEEALAILVRQRTVKDWYTTEEIARLLGRASYTVREHCREGRVKAAKRPCGRGSSKEWMVSHEELLRVQSFGLLPVDRLQR